MKRFLGMSLSAVSLLAGLASGARAEVTIREDLVHQTRTSVEIELTPETVVCSHADYSAAFLKVLMPELAPITLLDHQNLDAGAPCVAAGPCAPFGDAEPADILDDTRPTEPVDIDVQATRIDQIDDQARTCQTSLRERVDVVIRGVAFFHERYAELGSRPYGDCVPGGEEAGGGDDKADRVETIADSDAPAGCAAGGDGATGAGMALALFGMVITARRRRLRAGQNGRSDQG
jgi:uncharacterized protein (TIGR03382 family)